MSASNFDNCLSIILHHEGGYVNHPKDPGGITNKGVTKAVYDKWIGRESTVQEMKDLSESDVGPIYKNNYWDKLKCDDLPDGLDLCVFDFGVNAGPGRSAKYLQKVVGTTVDGGIGPNTLKAVNDHISDVGLKETIRQFQEDRQGYYERLSTFDTFGRGWTRRVTETTDMAIEMV